MIIAVYIYLKNSIDICMFLKQNLMIFLLKVRLHRNKMHLGLYERNQQYILAEMSRNISTKRQRKKRVPTYTSLLPLSSAATAGSSGSESMVLTCGNTMGECLKETFVAQTSLQGLSGQGRPGLLNLALARAPFHLIFIQATRQIHYYPIIYRQNHFSVYCTAYFVIFR